MSIAIIKIKDQEIPMLKKFIDAFTGAKMRVINNEDYQEEIMSKLIEEGLKSKILSEEQVKKEFKKHGVSY